MPNKSQSLFKILKIFFKILKIFFFFLSKVLFFPKSVVGLWEKNLEILHDFDDSEKNILQKFMTLRVIKKFPL